MNSVHLPPRNIPPCKQSTGEVQRHLTFEVMEVGVGLFLSSWNSH